MTALTRDEVVAVLGSVDDTVVAEVLAMGATREELTEAHAWTLSDEALMNAGRSLPSGRVGRLVEILQLIEEEASDIAPPEEVRR